MQLKGWFLSLLIVELAVGPIYAGHRVALAVGCQHYPRLREADQLASPIADAEDMSQVFSKMGYRLITGGALRNPSREQLVTAIENLAKAARGADAVVFYYSGHGIEVDGDNHLLPADTPHLESLHQLRTRALQLKESVMVLLDESRALNKVIILDCCRDNPFSAPLVRASGKSAKSVSPGSIGEINGYGPGFYLAFSTSSGQTALDGNGERNSPFTRAMLHSVKNFATKDIDFFFRDVKRQMPRHQTSWTNSSLTDPFALATVSIEFTTNKTADRQLEIEKRAREIASQMERREPPVQPQVPSPLPEWPVRPSTPPIRTQNFTRVSPYDPGHRYPKCSVQQILTAEELLRSSRPCALADAEMSAVYNSLRTGLNSRPADKELLKLDQLNWLCFRAAELSAAPSFKREEVFVELSRERAQMLKKRHHPL
jgi:hypothetical protein